MMTEQQGKGLMILFLITFAIAALVSCGSDNPVSQPTITEYSYISYLGWSQAREKIWSDNFDLLRRDDLTRDAAVIISDTAYRQALKIAQSFQGIHPPGNLLEFHLDLNEYWKHYLRALTIIHKEVYDDLPVGQSKGWEELSDNQEFLNSVVERRKELTQ